MSSVSAQSNKKRKLEDISNKKSPAIPKKSIKSDVPSTKVVQSDAKSHKNGKKPDHLAKDSNERQRSSSRSNQGQKSGKKLLNDEAKMEIEEERDQEIEMTQSQVIIGNMFSLYALAEKQPQKIKLIIDQIFAHQDKSEEFIVKTMFLYFLELIGFTEIETLSYNANFIARNSDETKLLSIFSQDDKFEISFEKLVFFSQEKKALEQKKLLKRVCKIFISNVVDLLPDKASYLEAITKRVCIFSKSHQRLVRYAFSYIGLYMYKFLLGQQGDLQKLRQGYEEKHKNETKLKQSDEAKKTLKRIDSIVAAMDEIQGNIDTIQKHLILKRSQDTQVIVRKSIYEFFLQLDEKEVQMAFMIPSQKDQQAYMDAIFDGLKDDDNQVKKVALQIIQQFLTKFNLDQQTTKVIEASLIKYKMILFNLSNMNEKNQDTQMAIKALQIVAKGISIITDLFNQDMLQSLMNLVHSQNMSIREEVGDLLLTLSDEFDDQNSLLELQKISASKGFPDDFTLNFQDEPNKSQKQLLKLIKMFEKHVQTGAQLLNMDGKAEDKNDLVVANIHKDEIQRRIENEHEERAVLLFQTYQRKTSVLFDVQSMTNILKKEDVDTSVKLVLVNLMKISLIYTEAMKNQKENPNLVFTKIQESQSAYLKLTVMNELIQTFRVETKILEPLLSSLLTLSKNLEKDSHNDHMNEELGKDLIILLLKIIDNTTVNEKHPETYQIVQKSILNLSSLQTHFPEITKQLRELGLNYCERLQQEIVPQLFNSEKEINTEHLSFLSKLNVIMAQIQIKQMADVEYLKGMCSFAIINYTQMIIDHYNLISKLSENQLKIMLQLPFTFIDQLLGDSYNHPSFIQYQQKLLHHLMDFYMDIFAQFKKEEQLQIVVLKYIVECLVLASGENKPIKGHLIQSLNDFPRAKELLTDLIQSVSGRLKGNEYVVQEQFKIIHSLFMRDFNSLISEVGVEFLINFGTSKDPLVSKEVRRLYYTYKQRDRTLDNKKGIFYTFVVKIIISIFNQPDAKIYRLQEQAPGDIKKEMVQLGLDDLEPTLTLENYSKLVFINNFIKTFLNSIMLLVISNKPKNTPGANGLTKSQDEFAYFKMVETIIRISIQDRKNIPMLYCIKYFMHKNFLNQVQQDAMIKGLKNLIDSSKENLSPNEIEQKVLDVTLAHIQEKISHKKIGGQKKLNESSILLDKTILPQNDQQEPEQQQNEELALKAVNDEITKHKEMIGKKRRQSSAAAKNQDSKQVQEESTMNKKMKKTK